MHSAERVLLPLLQVIGGKSGQSNIYSSLQNIFKFGYYYKKYWSNIFAILAMVYSKRECIEIEATFLNGDDSMNFEDMEEIYLGKEDNATFDGIPYIESKEQDDEFSFISAMNIPENIRIQFGNVCCSRWMSFVRQVE